MSRDTTEFLKLLKPYYNPALKYCRALSKRGSINSAEDLIQHSLLKAIEKFDDLKDDRKFKFWFFTIITNEFYSSVRKELLNKFISINNEYEIPSMPRLYDVNGIGELSEILLIALSKLKRKEKSAILLYELAGFSIEEIMHIQEEKSISCIKLRLSRGREKLRKYISKLETGKHFKSNTEKSSVGGITNETIKIISEVESGRNER
ncbi:MAG: RNA polymerase sigma factor [Ignavibacteria bacterium]|nr:RNA polymerase sigma factor [Ignavibacteria bacterium]